MVKEILFVVWLFLIIGAFTTAFRTKKLVYGTEKYGINLFMCAAFNILALTVMIIRSVIN